jgi:hypothetical protein
MSEDLEVMEGASGLDRRTFIKRSAVVGGMVWAAPVLQSLSSPAFAFTPSCQDISYLAFILANVDETNRWKYESNGPCTFEAGGEIDNVCASQFPDLATEFSNTSEGSASDEPTKFTLNCDDPKQWIISPTANYKVVWALVKSGGADKCTLFSSEYAKGEAVTVYQDC